MNTDKKAMELLADYDFVKSLIKSKKIGVYKGSMKVFFMENGYSPTNYSNYRKVGLPFVLRRIVFLEAKLCGVEVGK